MTFATVSTPPAPLARLLSAFQHDPRSLPRLLGPSNALSTARVSALRGAHPLGAALQEVEPVVRRARSPLAGCSLPDAFRHLWALVADGKRLPLGPFGFPRDQDFASSNTPRRVPQGCKPQRLPPPPSGTDPVHSAFRVLPDSATPPGCFHLARLAMPLLPEMGGLPRRALLRCLFRLGRPREGRIASLPPETCRSTSMASTTV